MPTGAVKRQKKGESEAETRSSQPAKKKGPKTYQSKKTKNAPRFDMPAQLQRTDDDRWDRSHDGTDYCVGIGHRHEFVADRGALRIVVGAHLQ